MEQIYSHKSNEALKQCLHATLINRGQKERRLPWQQQIVLVANKTQQPWLVVKGEADSHGLKETNVDCW